MRAPSLLTQATLGLALASTGAAQAVMGFNSGSTIDNGQVKVEADFEKEMVTARNLAGAPGVFSSVRLYTMVQGGTQSDPISAFSAAMKTNTTLLLGIWCSGTTTIQNDLDALSKAIAKYGQDFTRLVVGISVGSEDLYRNSVTGAINKAGIGADPSVLVGFIQQVRNAIKGTPLANTPVGHVDTWDVWGNASNKAVVDAIDFLGTDAYPYYQNTTGDNSIGAAKGLWDAALASARAAANGKPVWVTETGWPSSGPAWGNAQAGLSQAQQYWASVGCSLFGKTNTWWYTLRDSNPANEAKFAVSNGLSTTPLYNLTCPVVPPSSSATGPAATASAGSAAKGGSSASGGSSGGSTGGGAVGSGGSSASGTGKTGTATSGTASGSTAKSSTSSATSGSGTAKSAGVAGAVAPGAGIALAAAIAAFAV